MTALVESTGEPAFMVDLQGTIRAWNQPAEESLGYLRSQAVGRSCWEVLAGRDLFGNRYCGPACPLVRMARRREGIHCAELSLRTASGIRRRFRVCSLLVADERTHESALVHQLCDLGPPEPPPSKDEEPAEEDRNGRHRLTSREREILHHLAEGRTTDELAESLCISPATVRNHIRHVLRKLGAHSRLEAVARGRRLGFL